MGDQDLDPLFVDPFNNDYRIQESSPCRGSGRYGDDRGALPYVQSSIDDINPTPVVFEFYANYPNPFNASTTINYSLTKNSFVIVKVFDIIGCEIATLLETRQDAGYYKLVWIADNNPSGIYFYRITADDYALTRRMTLIK